MINLLRQIYIRIAIKDILDLQRLVKYKLMLIVFGIVAEHELDLLIILIKVFLQQRDDILFKDSGKRFQGRVLNKPGEERMTNGMLSILLLRSKIGFASCMML